MIVRGIREHSPSPVRRHAQADTFYSPYINYTFDESLLSNRTTKEIAYIGCPERVEQAACPLALTEVRYDLLKRCHVAATCMGVLECGMGTCHLSL